ncbi:hypothetical protein FZEAL_5418 [Fusarium zealandicum]|uniref:AMP-dependent synthetase/ligase domain-containing protein n=1 Tax=Fusarium zealandicum TaxID=1053134 RepID=A0A8H4UK83_9HYPO|nr:hypothetical protein FZEAL_5418 [Fusarium zealandicum]
MSTLRTHLSILQDTAAKYPLSPVLKTPQDGTAEIAWDTITFSAFQRDVELCARYWADRLQKQGTNQRSVVGVWLKGVSYLDVLHMWGLARAGYIPQFISLRMTDPSVVYQLLDDADAVALIHDIDYESILEACPLQTYPAVDFLTDPNLESQSLPALWKPEDPEDITMVYHTSGSTSGIPKLVPLTARWLDSMIEKTGHTSEIRRASQGQQVEVAIGSFSHIGSNLFLVDAINRGGCLILPTGIPYPTAELRQMVKQEGLNMLNMFPTFLSKVFSEARCDQSLLTILQQLDCISIAGLAIDPSDDSWARANGLRLINFFGSTEVGCMLVDHGNAAPCLTPLPGTVYEFRPLEDGLNADEQLLELVVPPESPDCPVKSLRGPDGKFYTGDLFVEAGPGQYLPRGRHDNWIKMETALRCDTGSIEADAMKSCGDDLIDAVVVVGVGRPSPTMIVEPKAGVESDEIHLKREILERIAPFHQRRYVHERIDDARYIMVVPSGTLPRTATKGNIRRTEVEKTLKSELDGIYAI